MRAVVLLLAAVLGAGGLWMAARDGASVGGHAVPADDGTQATSTTRPAPTPSYEARPPGQPRSVPPLASDTLAEARDHGDPRAPPMERQPELPQPSTWDLATPEHYQQFEQRQQQRMHARFMQAADAELPRWRALLVQARARGASPAALAAAEDKIRHLEQVQAALRRGERLGDR